MLLTVILPMGVVAKRLIWPWRIIARSLGVGIPLIGLWLAAVAVIVLAAILRLHRLAVAYLAIAVVGLLLFTAGFVMMIVGPDFRLPTVPSGAKLDLALNAMLFAAAIGTLTTATIRVRAGSSRPIELLQVLFGFWFLVMPIVLYIVVEAPHMSDPAGMCGGLVGSAIIGTGGLLAMLQGIQRVRSGILARVAMGFVQACLILKAVSIALAPTTIPLLALPLIFVGVEGAAGLAAARQSRTDRQEGFRPLLREQKR